MLSQLLSGGIWALSMSLFGFGMGTMLANFHMWGIQCVGVGLELHHCLYPGMSLEVTKGRFYSKN